MLLKNIKYLFLVSILSLSILSSCHDDEYSTDNFTANLATVNIIGNDSTSYYFTLDDGTILFPSVNPFTNYKFGGKQRVFLNYTILSDSVPGYDHSIRVNNINNILTKDIVFSENSENSLLDSDPTKIVSIWAGDNYLNFRFKFMLGGENIQHSINLISSQTIDSDTIYLVFKHDAHSDPQRYEEMTYAAFDLRPLIKSNSNNKITFLIETLDYDNVKNSYIVDYIRNAEILKTIIQSPTLDSAKIK